jgi:hypothetical protein
MRKIRYNLAAKPQVNVRAFAGGAVFLALASLALGGVAAANLARRHGVLLREKSETGMIAGRVDEMNREGRRMRNEIDVWRKKWGAELAAANRLIERKSFSFVSRLDFLEKAFTPGIRIVHISLANEEAGRISMLLTAQSLKELFGLYKKLAPYDLVITSETQTQDEYQVHLNFNIHHEKI